MIQFLLLTAMLMTSSLGVDIDKHIVIVSGSNPVKANTLRGNLSVLILNGMTGELDLQLEMDAGVKANWNAITQDRTLLVGANSITIKGQNGTVRTYAVNSFLSKLNSVEVEVSLLSEASVGSQGTSSLVIHPSKRWIVTANYRGGSVSVLPLDSAGRVSPAVTVIKHEGTGTIAPVNMSRPHDVAIMDGKYVFIPDLGLDAVFIYELDTVTGDLTPNSEQPRISLPPGSGPRHINFHPQLPVAYLINERSYTIVTFTYTKSSGTLEFLQVLSTVPANVSTESGNADISWRAAEIAVHPSGNFVYGTTRGHNSIACYKVVDGGKLLLVDIKMTSGNWPRGFEVSTDGKWAIVCNEREKQLEVFKIESTTGILTSVYLLNNLNTGPNNVLIFPAPGPDSNSVPNSDSVLDSMVTSDHTHSNSILDSMATSVHINGIVICVFLPFLLLVLLN